MIPTLFLAAAVMLISVTSSWGSKSYRARLVHPAHITVDGDLSEWEDLDVHSEQIDAFPPQFASTAPTDLSATFSCLMDRQTLYIGVHVIDNKLLYGTERFPYGFYDDCVEVRFDGDMKNPGKTYFDRNDGIVRVVGDSESGGRIEGDGGLFRPQPPHPEGIEYDAQFPGMWDVLGVVGEFQETEDGYTIEFGIPASVLGLSQFTIGTEMGLNIAVLDDDDGGIYDRFVDWNATVGGAESTGEYGRLTVFDANISKDTSFSAAPRATVTDAQEVFLDLRSYDQSETATWHALFANADKGPLRQNLEQLISVRKDPAANLFALSAMARLAWREGNHKEAIRRYEQIASFETAGAGVKLFALEMIAKAHEAVGDRVAVVDALTRYAELAPSSSASPGPLQLAQFYDRIGLNKQAADYYLTVLSLGPSDLVRHRVAIGLASVMTKHDPDYKKALKVLESVLEEDSADAAGTYETRRRIVDALWKMGRLETVATWLVRMLEEASAHDSHRGQIQLELVRFYFQTGQYELARRKIDRLQVEAPESEWAKRGQKFLNAFPIQLDSHQ